MVATTRAISFPQIENWLDSHGATYDRKTVAIDKIDYRRSLKNQARIQPLDESLVAVYAEAMQDGAKFPPIVLADDGKGAGMLVVDGNHRLAAAQLVGKTEVDAYVISNGTPRQITVMTFDANTKHGLPSSPEERRQHAVFLVETAGITAKDAARMLSVPTRELTLDLALLRADRRLASLGVDRWQALSRSSKIRLENIRSDVVFASTAQLAIQSKMGIQALTNLVTEINDQRTEAEALAVVEAERARQNDTIAATVGGRARLSTDMIRLTRALAYADRLATDQIEYDAITPETKEALKARISSAQEKLTSVISSLG